MGVLEIFAVAVFAILLFGAGWFIIDALFSGVDDRPCPRCGTHVKNGVLDCPSCGFDFHTIGAPSAGTEGQ